MMIVAQFMWFTVVEAHPGVALALGSRMLARSLGADLSQAII